MKHRIKGRPKQVKEKSLLRKFIEVMWEQLQRKKALRLLAKQEWSIDFLTYLLVKASRISMSPIDLLITAPNGTTLKLSSSTSTISANLDDSDDILNHLDEPDVVDAYITRHGR